MKGREGCRGAGRVGVREVWGGKQSRAALGGGGLKGKGDSK